MMPAPISRLLDHAFVADELHDRDGADEEIGPERIVIRNSQISRVFALRVAMNQAVGTPNTRVSAVVSKESSMDRQKIRRCASAHCQVSSKMSFCATTLIQASDGEPPLDVPVVARRQERVHEHDEERAGRGAGDDEDRRQRQRPAVRTSRRAASAASRAARRGSGRVSALAAGVRARSSLTSGSVPQNLDDVLADRHPDHVPLPGVGDPSRAFCIRTMNGSPVVRRRW